MNDYSLTAVKNVRKLWLLKDSLLYSESQCCEEAENNGVGGEVALFEVTEVTETNLLLTQFAYRMGEKYLFQFRCSRLH